MIKAIGGISIAMASLGYAAVQFLQVLWLSKEYGADALGAVSLILGFFSPVLSFLSSGQRFSVLTAMGADGRELSAHINLRMLMLLTTLVLSMFFAALQREVVPSISIVIAIGAYKLFDSQAELALWFLQKKGDLTGFLWLAISRFVPIPSATLISYFMGLSLEYYLWISTLLVGFLVATTLLFKKEGVFSWRPINLSLLKVSFVAVLPIGLAAGIESVAVTLPRYFLASLGSLSQVAAFVLFTQVSIVFGLVASSRLQSNIPKYAEFARDDPSKVKGMLLRSLLVMFLMISVMYIPIFIMPNDLVIALLGRWVSDFGVLLYFLPLLALVWYSGGYVANVAAIVGSRNFLLQNSILLIFIVSGFLLLGWAVGADVVVVGFGSIFLAFAARLLFSFYYLSQRLRV